MYVQTIHFTIMPGKEANNTRALIDNMLYGWGNILTCESTVKCEIIEKLENLK